MEKSSVPDFSPDFFGRHLLGAGPAWYTSYEQHFFAESMVLLALVSLAILFELGHHKVHHYLHHISFGAPPRPASQRVVL